MSEQQPNESKPSHKGGAGHSSQKPDQTNEIIHKSGNQSGQQAGQQSSQEAQRRRDAHTNSAAAGRGDEPEDIRERSGNSPV